LSFDYILRGGLIFDGTRHDSAPRKEDIGIKGDFIDAVGDLSDVSACCVIDVKDLSLCPGFIDAHAHSEFTLLADGRAEGKICQGITTEINGNCGLSAAPLYGQALEKRVPELEDLGIRERWNSLDEYFAVMRNKKFATNFMTMAGHGNLRSSVVGFSEKILLPNEKEKMVRLLVESLHAGAKGLSTGLVYPPGVYADTSELVDIARVASSQGGMIYTTHMRNEDDNLMESLEEAIKIGHESGLPLHVSHLKTSGEQNWHKMEDVFREIQRAHKQGLRVTCDRYPYTASCTDLDSFLPSWAYEGGVKEEIKRIRSMRKKLERDIVKRLPDTSSWEKVRISTVKTSQNKWMEGKSLLEISKTLKSTPLQCFFDVLVEEKLRVDAIFFSMSEENLKAIFKRPYTVFGTDSSARSYNGITSLGKPHPRGYGTFPRILGRYVREQGVLDLNEAIYRMTGLPANIFGIKKRGMIKKGYFADITVFDSLRVQDRASYEEPLQKPEGIYHVFVNGIPALMNGEPTSALPGRILT
jgi:N-acyl-D-amino-acid deacylase